MTASGDRWEPTEQLSIFADALDQTQVITSTTTDGTGHFEVTFTVPNMEPGSYKFFACQRCDEVENFPHAYASFTVVPVLPALSIEPDHAAPGATVSATGGNWNSYEQVSIFADRSSFYNGDKPIAVTTTDDVGAVDTTFPIPTGLTGTHRLFACQRCGDPDGFPNATAPLTVTSPPAVPPTLSIGPDHARPGAEVTATGTGWLPAERLSIFADRSDSSDQGKALAVATTGTAGALDMTFAIPIGLTGRHQFYACQRCSDPGPTHAYARFTVTSPLRPAPGLSITPAEAAPGAGVTASGSGWLPSERVSVFADRSDGTDPAKALATIGTDGVGAFVATFTVPTGLTGTRQFYACQRCSDPKPVYASTSFTVVALQRVPSWSVTPDRAAPGATLTASGSGWLPSERVSIFADRPQPLGGATAITTTTTDAAGHLATTFTVPTGQSGARQLYACQRCSDPEPSYAYASFTVTAAPSSASSSAFSGRLLALMLLGMLVVLVAATTLVLHRRKRPPPRRSAHLVPRPDPSFDVTSHSVGLSVPSLRLIPSADDLTVIDLVEVDR